ncbi:MAG TPA: glycosyltransferase family 87 protein [Planctomycetaceae bacterium]|nr:glycosyltransferase family 87 protein [Planctomycetaceae bacterium]
MPATRLLERIRNHAAARAPAWNRVAVALVAAVFLIQWAHVAVRPRGDFHLHWESGRRLVAGEFLYDGSLNCSYPPFWALAHAPLTVLPMHAAQVLLFPLCALALAALVWSLADVLREHLPASRGSIFWSSVLALGLASRFLVRDMLECGVNLALVAASWAAVALWMRRRDGWAGILLGAAIALKCTPALFLAWFLWKRQWKVAIVTAATTAVLTLSPILVMGGRAWSESLGYWVQLASRGAGHDPSQGVLGEEPLQNISLRAALGRFLMRLPAGHAGRIDHPLDFDALDLSPAAAGWTVKLLTLLLVGWVAWSFRGRVVERRRLDLVWECAAVSILLLLLSPITWGQHCVGVVPVLYVLARTSASGRHVPAWARWTVSAYAVLLLGLNRAVVGQKLSWLLDSYHVTTWCLVALLVVAVRCRSLAVVPVDGRASGRLLNNDYDVCDAHRQARPC